MCSSAVLRKHCSTCQSRPFRSYNLHYPKRSLPQTEQVEQQHVPHALMHCFDSPNVCPNKKNAIIFDCLNHLLNHILNHLLNHLWIICSIIFESSLNHLWNIFSIIFESSLNHIWIIFSIIFQSSVESSVQSSLNHLWIIFSIIFESSLNHLWIIFESSLNHLFNHLLHAFPPILEKAPCSPGDGSGWTPQEPFPGTQQIRSGKPSRLTEDIVWYPIENHHLLSFPMKNGDFP